MSVYPGHLGAFTATDAEGNRQPYAPVHVFDDPIAQNHVALYVNLARSALPNPFSADSEGYVTCWAEPGDVWIATEIGGVIQTPKPFTIGKHPFEPASGALPGDVVVAPAVGDVTADTFSWTTAINAVHAQAHGGRVIGPPGAWTVNDLPPITRPDVSIIGAGLGATILNHVGDGTCLTLHKPGDKYIQPRGDFLGFAINGAGAGANARGVHGVDWSYSRMCFHVGGYAGSGARGVVMENVDWWTERNQMVLSLDTNKVNIEFIGPTETPINSFAANEIELRMNVHAGQKGIHVSTGAYIYGGDFGFFCNVDGAGTVMHVEKSSHMEGERFNFNAEQTAGTGGVGIKIDNGASTAPADANSEVWGHGVFRFGGNPPNNLPHDVPPPSHRGSLRLTNNEAMDTVQRIAVADAGTIANFGGSGNAGTVVPLLWDQIAGPHALIGFIVGNNLRSVFATLFNAPGNKFVLGRSDFGGLPSDMTEIFEVDYLGNVSLPTGAELKLAQGGTAPTSGRVRLVGGVATVPTTAVKNNTQIVPVVAEASGAQGIVVVQTRTPNVSFVLVSTNPADTCLVDWFFVGVTGT